MSVWDDPGLKAAAGDYVKLENRGDVIEGTVRAVRAHDFGDGKPPVPQLDLTTPDGRDVTWTAGQVQAKIKLVELRPEPGDYLRAELTDIEKRAGGKTLKHIDVQVRKPGAAAVSPLAAVAARQGAALAAVQAGATRTVLPDEPPF